MAETKKKPNRLLIMGVILAALVVLVVFAADPFGLFKPSEEEREQAQGLSKVLCNVTGMQITAFEIKPPDGDSFRVSKDANGQWHVQIKDKTYRADQARVDKLVEQVPGLKAEGSATKSKDKYPLYEVDAALGIGLKVYTGAETPAASFIVGKADSSYQGCFLLVENDPAVYRANQNIKSLVGFAANDFRTRNPWKFEPATATSITIRPPKGDTPAVTLVKNGEYWQVSGKNANQNLVKETLKKLTELTVNDYVDTPDPAQTKMSPAPAIIVKTNLAEYKLTLGAADNSQQYVQDQDGWVFRTSEYAMKFYSDLAMDQLTLDDTAKDQAQAGTGAPAAGAMPGAAPSAMPPGAGKTPTVPPSAAKPPSAPPPPSGAGK
jgi:hypothetical protein